MDVISSFSLLLRVSQIFGLAPFKIQKQSLFSVLKESRTRRLWTELTFFLVVSVAGFLLCNPTKTFQITVSSTLSTQTVKILFFFAKGSNCFCNYITLLTKPKRICYWNNAVNELYCEKWHKLTSSNKKLVLIYFLMQGTGHALAFPKRDLPGLINGNFFNLIKWWYLVFGSLVEECFMCLVMTFVNIACFKIQQINEDLLFEREKNKNVKSLVRKFRRWRAEDNLLKDYVDFINSTFKINLLLYNFQLLVGAVLVSVELISNENVSKFYVIFFLAYLFSRVAIAVSVCVRTQEQAEKTANYVHELFLHNNDPEIKEEVEIFSLQLQHRKVEFNACGFFRLDFTLLYSMIGAVTTYIIILMQFQREDSTTKGWLVWKTKNCSLLMGHTFVDDILACLNNTTPY